jgi:hypothetical protein
MITLMRVLNPIIWFIFFLSVVRDTGVLVFTPPNLWGLAGEAIPPLAVMLVGRSLVAST